MNIILPLMNSQGNQTQGKDEPKSVLHSLYAYYIYMYFIYIYTYIFTEGGKKHPESATLRHA